MSASDLTDPKLAEALAECDRLREENRQLQERLGIAQAGTTVPFTPRATCIHNGSGSHCQV